MSTGILTNAGRDLFAQKAGAGEVLTIDRFLLANIPGLDPQAPADPNETLPDLADRVAELAVTKSGYVNEDKVVYSLYLGTGDGDYTFNWVGILADDDTLVAVRYIEPIDKYATSGLNVGNSITRNFLVTYTDAQSITNITVDASTWQLSFDQATEIQAGMAKVATQALVDGGEDDLTLLTPKKLANSIFARRNIRWFPDLSALLQANYLKLNELVGIVSRSVEGDGGGNVFKVVSPTTGTHDNGSLIDHPKSNKQLKGLFPYGANIVQWGVQGFPNNDTPAIQRAIDYCSSSGVLLKGAAGTWGIGSSGNQVGIRYYGLLLKSNLHFDGLVKNACIFKVLDGADIDPINTDRSVQQSNIVLRNFVVHGNSANQSSAAGFNIWAYDIENFTMENVTSIDSESWGYRIQNCNNVSMSNIRSDHIADVNADGCHFVDCSNVIINGMNIYTQGDDGFIIEALHSDVKNYTVTGLNVRTPEGEVTAARRGILIFREDSLTTGKYLISNINISATVADCDGQGIILTQGDFYNVNITATVENSLNGLYIDPGAPNYSGELRGCSFNINCLNSKEDGLIVLEQDGSVTDNYIEMTILNPADGEAGAVIRGKKWKGSVSVDYNPYGDKTIFGTGINLLQAENNNLFLECKDAGTNLLVQGNAKNNNIELGEMTGATISNLTVSSGATGNRFSGGRIESPFSLSSNPKFFGTAGATNYGGASSLAVDGNGNANIPHGLIAAPNFASLQMRTDIGNIFVDVQSVDSTNIVARFKNGSGQDVTSGNYAVYWEASL